MMEEQIESQWTSAKIRNAFLKNFESHGHNIVRSSSVEPWEDETLLFVNAGMNQFKSIFLGLESAPSIPRVCNSQKCIRAGGKHNDLEDVGLDGYHHTFFEMLGNWSFGDYFKEEAIGLAWDLLINVFNLPRERIFVTYFGGDGNIAPDHETRKIWERFVSADQILPFSRENFWEMGDLGPCGPCTEIHFDCIGKSDAQNRVNRDDPDVMEVWNIVFMQYNRERDGTLRALPNQHVDTGMGLERMCRILQKKSSNYQTDIFADIIKSIEKITGGAPYSDATGDADWNDINTAYRVIADHIRTVTIAIADGISPGKNGRNYVVRRLLRRAVFFGREKLKAPSLFLGSLVDDVIQSLGFQYPDLIEKSDHVRTVITQEEVQFGKTLRAGLKYLKKALDTAHKPENGDLLSGETIFELWSTFGFPIDLSRIIVGQHQIALKIDEAGLQKQLELHRERSMSSKIKKA